MLRSAAWIGVDVYVEVTSPARSATVVLALLTVCTTVIPARSYEWLLVQAVTR